MSRVFSFRDLQRIPELSKFREVELLHPSLDPLVNCYLVELGFDPNKPIQYRAAKHRDLSGKVAVGFMAVGEINPYSAFVKSSLCSLSERLIAAWHTDPELARDMATLMGSSLQAESSAIEEDDTFPEELVEPDYDEVVVELLNLENIKYNIRGSPYAEDGSLKLPRLE
jgi:hypothetical protein